jgi:hypothetical protein
MLREAYIVLTGVSRHWLKELMQHSSCSDQTSVLMLQYLATDFFFRYNKIPFTVEAEILSALYISVSLLFCNIQRFDRSTGMGGLMSRHTEKGSKMTVLWDSVPRSLVETGNSLLTKCYDNDSDENVKGVFIIRFSRLQNHFLYKKGQRYTSHEVTCPFFFY